MQLPEKYVNSMKELLADEFDSYMESFNEKRLYGLRVNTAKISVEDFMKICPFHIERIPWIPNGFYYSEMTNRLNIRIILQDFIIYRSPVR